MKTKLPFLLILFCAYTYAQTTVNGSVSDDSGQPLPGANVIVVGTSVGTVTDFDGKFSLTVNQSPPFSIQASSVGFQTVTQEVTSNLQTIDFSLLEGTELDEIVVSASRTPESVRESPVTIERFDAKDISNSATPNFYTSLENLKGVDVNHGSLTFNSVNTRGFATFANTRFVQLIDGMDNSSPALNFVMGNLVGMNELDVKSVELLPGASSALYGANAFNGILFMTSKSPFDYPGISAYYKKGITSQKLAGDNNYTDFGLRMAHKFSDKFAAKASVSYLTGTDWHANDTNQYVLSESGTADDILPFRSGPAHNGLNVYGDEVNLSGAGTNLNQVAQQTAAVLGIPQAIVAAYVPAINVARTGYLEQDLTDYDAKSLKTDFSLNYRPFADDLEIIWNSRIGIGGTIYQGSNRYTLKNFTLQQHKLEIRNDDFFVRGYTTFEDGGDSYDMRFTGINMNKVGAAQWFGTYAGGYLNGVLGALGAGLDPNDPNLQASFHAGARAFADATLTLQPGTPEFKALFDQVTSDPNITSGSQLKDNSQVYVGEGNYNFKRLLNDAVDLQVGGSYRQYSLNSDGSVFTDYDGPIKYDEIGAYVQAIKKFADDRFKVTGSIRYDKNEFFDASYSPRLSLVYAAGENKEHNIRASFQTGFRNPDTQALFIGFDIVQAVLVGGASANLDRDLPGTDLTGRDAYNDSYTLNSLLAFGASAAAGAPDVTLLKPVNGTGVTPLVEQEKVTAFDVGYRGNVGPITIDFNAYYNTYDNFLSQPVVATPNSGTVADASGIVDIATGNFRLMSLYTNSNANVNSYGVVLGLSTRIANNYRLGLNYTNSQFDFDKESDPSFSVGFNTPEHKVNLSLGNENLFDNFGFNVNFRWSDEYLWQASIANAMIPSRTVVDAQLNYRVPSIKSIFKIGATNLGGKEFQSAVGTGFIGSQYFVSWTINN